MSLPRTKPSIYIVNVGGRLRANLEFERPEMWAQVADTLININLILYEYVA
jgi:hypothetical protein